MANFHAKVTTDMVKGLLNQAKKLGKSIRFNIPAEQISYLRVLISNQSKGMEESFSLKKEGNFYQIQIKEKAPENLILNDPEIIWSIDTLQEIVNRKSATVTESESKRVLAAIRKYTKMMGERIVPDNQDNEDEDLL